MRHPILINRPIVVTPKGVKLCRPSETGAGLEAFPTAARQEGPPKFNGCVAEPSAMAQDVHALFTIHVGGPGSDKLAAASDPIAQNWPTWKPIACNRPNELNANRLN